MDWYPLRLSTPVKSHVFGGRAIPERLGRAGLPGGRIAETWEVSDVDGDGCEVLDGPLAGHTLRELATRHAGPLTGGEAGPRFPLLTKFIDATGPLPVHLHADDDRARLLEGEPNGKTEAWHILDAVPGATALVGVRPGVDRATLHRALLAQDFDAVMRRLPVRAGETVYVPGGTLHTFGPGTLVYEIEQTSDIQQHAMRWRMEDGSRIGDDEWHAGLERLLAEWEPRHRPVFQPGLRLPGADGTGRTVLCAGPYFALERWWAAAGAVLVPRFRTARVLGNAGAPVTVLSGGAPFALGRAETLLLPAALGTVEIPGPADVLFGYVPDLEADVRRPLRDAGYADRVIADLGDLSGTGGRPRSG